MEARIPLTQPFRVSDFSTSGAVWSVRTSAIFNVGDNLVEMNCASVELEESYAPDFASILSGETEALSRFQQAQVNLLNAAQGLHEASNGVAGSAMIAIGSSLVQIDPQQVEHLNDANSAYNDAVNGLADAEKYRYTVRQQTAQNLGEWARELGITSRNDLDVPDLYLSGPPLSGQPATSWEEFAAGYVRRYGFSAKADPNVIQAMQNQLAQIPLPIYSSPPAKFETAASYLGGSAWAGMVLTTYETQGPVVAVIAGSSVFLIWFATPAVKVARQATKNWAAKKLSVKELDKDD